jgi:hypothetical protein
MRCGGAGAIAIHCLKAIFRPLVHRDGVKKLNFQELEKHHWSLMERWNT